MSGSNAPPANTVYANGFGVLTDAQLNTFVQGAMLEADLRNFVGLQGMTSFLNGLSAPNDGGAGNFYWNPTSMQADDGTNVIRPHGLVIGAWIRVTATGMGSNNEVTVVANIAALRAITTAPSQVVWVEGYYAGADGGEGMFLYVPSDTTSADNGGTVIVDAANQRWYRELSGAPVYARQFGCKGGGNDDTTAIAAFVNYVCTSGYPGNWGKGTFISNSQVVFSLNAQQKFGITLNGAGPQQSILDVRGVAASPQAIVECTNSPGDNYYLEFLSWGILGETTGITFQVGQENYSDPVNEPWMNMWVFNASTVSTACALELNYVLNGNLRFIANTPSDGVAMRIRQLTTSFVQGSYAAGNPFASPPLWGTAIHITDGYTNGNSFASLDLENVLICLAIDSPNATNNVFMSGEYSYNTAAGHAVNFTAGNDNVLISPNPAPTLGNGATLANFIAPSGYIGLLIQATKVLGITTPSMPASGSAVVNATGQTVNAYIWGGTVSSVVLSGGGIGLTSGTFQIPPGDSIAIDYSAAPTWDWKPTP